MTTKHLVYTALMTAIICIFRYSTKCTSAIYASPYCITEYRNLLAGIILGRKLGTTSVIVFYYW